MGAAQGRLPARPDPRQRREEGTGRRGGDAGEEVRHRHAVHQLPGRAGRPDAGRRRGRARPATRRAAPIGRCRGRRSRRHGGFGGGGRRRPAAPPGVATGPAATPSRRAVEDFAKAQAGGKGDGKRGLGGQPRRRRPSGRSKEALDELKDEKDPADQREAAREDVQAVRSEQKKTLGRRELRGSRATRTATRPASSASIWPQASNNLRNQDRLCLTANRRSTAATAWRSAACGSTTGSRPTRRRSSVKAQSDAYFRILEKQPEMKDVFRLGNHLVWISPERHGPGDRPERRQGEAGRRGDRRRCSPKK